MPKLTITHIGRDAQGEEIKIIDEIFFTDEDALDEILDTLEGCNGHHKHNKKHRRKKHKHKRKRGHNRWAKR